MEKPHIIFSGTSLEDFWNQFEKRIEAKILKLFTAYQPRGDPSIEYLTHAESCKFLKMSKPTFNKIRKAGLITSIKSSRKRLLFRKSDLVEYLEKTK